MNNTIANFVNEFLSTAEFSDPIVLDTSLGEFSGRYASDLECEGEEFFRYFYTDDDQLLRIYLDEGEIYNVMEPYDEEGEVIWETV